MQYNNNNTTVPDNHMQQQPYIPTPIFNTNKPMVFDQKMTYNDDDDDGLFPMIPLVSMSMPMIPNVSQYNDDDVDVEKNNTMAQGHTKKKYTSKKQKSTTTTKSKAPPLIGPDGVIIPRKRGRPRLVRLSSELQQQSTTSSSLDGDSQLDHNNNNNMNSGNSSDGQQQPPRKKPNQRRFKKEKEDNNQTDNVLASSLATTTTTTTTTTIRKKPYERKRPVTQHHVGMRPSDQESDAQHLADQEQQQQENYSTDHNQFSYCDNRQNAGVRAGEGNEQGGKKEKEQQNCKKPKPQRKEQIGLSMMVMPNLSTFVCTSEDNRLENGTCMMMSNSSDTNEMLPSSSSSLSTLYSAPPCFLESPIPPPPPPPPPLPNSNSTVVERRKKVNRKGQFKEKRPGLYLRDSYFPALGDHGIDIFTEGRTFEEEFAATTSALQLFKNINNTFLDPSAAHLSSITLGLAVCYVVQKQRTQKKANRKHQTSTQQDLFDPPPPPATQPPQQQEEPFMP